ncbi:MAG: carboxymuconolactone decarboxylase family protein [Betaproteobacteria bacterium]|nr:carboxymuconolactone decarboxylase family protein [Betaproteobacteria bacterium]
MNMSRLVPADEQSRSELAAAYAEITRTRGYVSNILKSLSHAPEGLRRFAAFGEYVRYQTRLPGRLRELAILAIARGIQYAWTHHAPIAHREGVTQQEIDAVNEGRIPSSLGAAEKAAVRYAQEFANLGNVGDATFAEVAKHFDERQITDLTLLCCYFVALGSTINAFGIGLEPDRKPLMKPVK